MAKIVSSSFISLDGVINHMDKWHFAFVDDESDAIALEQLRSAPGGLLMGRNTYEVYASVWPGRDGEYADMINAAPKYVASTTLTDPDWVNTTVIEGNLVGEVAKLKASGGGDLLMHGYGPVAKELTRHGLLDELHLWLHPMFSGVGTIEDTLFAEGLNTRFELLDVRELDSGVILLAYNARADAAAGGN
jgi:dihydrofolate reductase